VEVDATKREAWIRKPEAWIPKLGFRGGGCDEAGGLDSATRSFDSEAWTLWRWMRRSRRLGFGNPKLGFQSLDSVEVDATKRAWRLGFGNNRWICVVNFAIQNVLQRFLGTFLQANFSFGHNELENILFLRNK
jgi:hypothetical protein